MCRTPWPSNNASWLRLYYVRTRVGCCAGEDTLLVSLRDLYDAVTRGLYGGRTDPLTGLPYRLQDSMPEAVLTQCRHWVNYPQVQPKIPSLCKLLVLEV